MFRILWGTVIQICALLYVVLISRDIFSLGFGPFRWVCMSGDVEDLRKSDKIAYDTMKTLAESGDGNFLNFPPIFKI